MRKLFFNEEEPFTELPQPYLKNSLRPECFSIIRLDKIETTKKIQSEIPKKKLPVLWYLFVVFRLEQHMKVILYTYSTVRLLMFLELWVFQDNWSKMILFSLGELFSTQ